GPLGRRARRRARRRDRAAGAGRPRGAGRGGGSEAARPARRRGRRRRRAGRRRAECAAREGRRGDLPRRDDARRRRDAGGCGRRAHRRPARRRSRPRPRGARVVAAHGRAAAAAPDRPLMRPRALAWLLLGPVAAWNLVFFVLPVAVMLGRMGLVNRALIDAGVVSAPLPILYTRWSVTVGMIQILLPLTVLTLYSAMLRIDQGLLHAAAAHGASPSAAFRRVFFPLSLPGVYGACLLTFVTSLGFYITPAL